MYVCKLLNIKYIGIYKHVVWCIIKQKQTLRGRERRKILDNISVLPFWIYGLGLWFTIYISTIYHLHLLFNSRD